MKKKSFIVECSECEAKVSADVLAEHEVYLEELGDVFVYFFLKCQSCSDPMVACSEYFPIGHNERALTSPRRVWPEPVSLLSYDIPSEVRRSVLEAEVCYKARAHTAALMMCRRAIEQLCLDRGAKKQNLFKMIDSLKSKKIIDGKLYEWAEVLREKGNLAAHEEGFVPKKIDVSDLLDFTRAICDYVYVLEEKYQAFLKRQK